VLRIRGKIDICRFKAVAFTKKETEAIVVYIFVLLLGKIIINGV